MHCTSTLLAIGLICGLFVSQQISDDLPRDSNVWDITTNKSFGTAPQRAVKPSQPTKGLIQHT